MEKKMSGGGKKGTQPKAQGMDERGMKKATVTSSSGLMSKDVTPKKGKGEF